MVFVQTWEHYSSIRNLDGPHAGLPHVKEKALSPEEEEERKAKLARAPIAQPWAIDVVSKSLPFLTDKLLIKKTLEECRGSIDLAVSKLLDAEEGSMSSAQESSSIEREADSEDDGVYGPNKRQDRRMSKATATLMKNKQEHRREMLAKIEQKDGSQLSIADSVSSQWEDVPESLPIRATQEEDDDSDWREASQGLTDDERSSAPPPSQEDKEKIKLKLNMSGGSTKTLTGGRTHARQLGPQARRRITARERKDQRKQAQKNARKQRAQQDAAAKAGTTNLPIRPANVNTSFTESFRTIAI